jgi:small-conductance mechanosensitive channel
MKNSQKLTLMVLLTLVVVAVAGLILTRSSPATKVAATNAQTLSAVSEPVNQRYLQKARELAALATTPEEQLLAQDAARVADHELDLAFAAALEEASNRTAAQTPEARELQERIEKIQSAVDTRQQTVRQLTEEVKTARGARLESLQQELQLTQAELDLYQDALGDVKADLVRAGGDERSRIQRLMDQHEALEHTLASATASPSSPAVAGDSSGSLIAKWRAWSATRQKRDQLLQAKQEAFAAAAGLAQNHDAGRQQVDKEQADRKKQSAAITTPAESGGQAPGQGLQPHSKEAVAAAVSSLRRISEEQKNLAILGRRIQNLNDLGVIYDKWDTLAKNDQRSALHGVIEYCLWIALTLLFAFLITELLDRIFARLKLEDKQRATLRTVGRSAAQVLAVLVILLMIFGKPTQLSTILGLATAGLTVALKDFIVSFMGWFVLMGRNGVRVGDLVEINGVRGEVIEISLMRTVLLETGNWTEAGHPTGRQVAFPNSYAIEGHYFNFSTSGQWLWDEFHVLIPTDQNPYPLVETLREIVAKETEGSPGQAEQDWQRVSRRYGVRPFSFEPTVSMKHADNGVDVTIRYISRAKERPELRGRLNQAIVNLLHQKPEFSPAPEDSPTPTLAKSR